MREQDLAPAVPRHTPAPPETGAAAALLAAVALAACGGGEALPEAFASPQQATTRRDLLASRERAAAAAVPLRTPTVSELLDWAERQYGQYFPGPEPNRFEAPYTYRYYPETGNYVGVAGSDIYILGPVSGGPLAFVGTLAEFAPRVTPTIVASSDEEAVRFLHQAQGFATDADIAAVRAQGYAAWLDAQFALPPSTGGWDWLASRGYNAVDDNRFWTTTYPGDYMAWQQLLASPDALRKRLALALSEYFVVSLSGLAGNWRPQLIANYWDTLAKHAGGKFRELLEAITLDPAMGQYLNTRGNQKENPATGRQPDENYAREVMQLFTIGLVELNPDGTAKLGAGGKPLETYTNDDITNLARVFTGWDYDFTTSERVRAPSGESVLLPAYTKLPMRFSAALHSTLEVNFLGKRIAADTPGQEALRQALDHLYAHANVGPFFGRQMIQRLVTSNPSPGYVARVAAAFADNGAGVRGDLKAVFKAILLDEEARTAAFAAGQAAGRLREPMLRFAQWARSFGVTSARGSWKIPDLSEPSNELGQSPLRSPSVFNFFRPGYVPPNTALASSGSVAPEFQIVTETSVAGYLNYMQGAIRNGLFVRAPDLPGNGSSTANGYDIAPAYTAELALVTDARALVARLNLVLCAGQLSAGAQDLIVNALNASPITAASTQNAKLDRIAAAVLMVMASAEYLVQK